MKVLLINGSPNENGCTYTGLKEVEKSLHMHNIDTEILYLGKKPMQDCIACYVCFNTGKCVFNDVVNELAFRLDIFDGIIIGSPVYYASATGMVRSFLNRLFFSAKDKLKNKVGGAIVSCRRGGASAAFDQLNKYFTINNMPVVSSNYWNQIHGMNPEEVLKDEEGMQTMRILGENMAWILKSIEAGKKSNLDEPIIPEKIMTNFIK